MSDNVMLLGTLIPIVAILLVGLLLLIPVAGLTLRFALKPAMEAYARMRETQGPDPAVQLLEQRVALLEQQLQSLAHGPQAGARGAVPVGQIHRPEPLPAPGAEARRPAAD